MRYNMQVLHTRQNQIVVCSSTIRLECSNALWTCLNRIVIIMCDKRYLQMPFYMKIYILYVIRNAKMIDLKDK